jgi:hypothetical protein
MIKFNKETLVELAGLGAGAAGSAYVKQKLLTKEDGTSVFGAGASAPILTDAAPVVIGLFLQGQSGFLKEAGKGMIAESIGSLIKKQFPTLGLAGMDSPLMGYDDMNVDNTPSPSAPLMGYSAGDAYDYTSGEAGEINY